MGVGTRKEGRGTDHKKGGEGRRPVAATAASLEAALQARWLCGFVPVGWIPWNQPLWILALKMCTMRTLAKKHRADLGIGRRVHLGVPGVALVFNPYQEWLGIPPGDQPPNHYRLLGIDPFESDLKVIEAAADRRMALVRTFQLGPNSKLSQRLLNELAAAKLVLVRPEKKAAYDQALRVELAARQAPSPATGLSAQPAAQGEPSPIAPVSQPAAAIHSAPLEPSAVGAPLEGSVASTIPMRQTSNLPIIFPALGGVLVAMVIGILVTHQPQPTEKQAESTSKSRTTATGLAKQELSPRSLIKPKTTETSIGGVQSAGGSDASDGTTATATPKNASIGGSSPRATRPPAVVETNTPAAPATPGAKLDARPQQAPPANMVAANSPIPSPANRPPTNSTPETRAADGPASPPNAEARAEALARIKENYRDDYIHAAEDENKTLRAKLVQRADFGVTTPAERDVLLEEAARLAADDDDMELAATLLAKLGQQFVVDEQAMKLKLAQQAVQETLTDRQRSSLLTQFQSLAELELQKQRYAEANNWLELALDVVTTMTDLRPSPQLRQLSADLYELGIRSEEAEVAQKQLAEQANLPDAHLVLGKFLCFLRDDWQEGLPHLVQGSDKALSAAAYRDLRTSTDAADQVAPGDAWFVLGESGSFAPSDRNAMHQRASGCYAKALGKLSGKEKIRVQRRLSKYPLVRKSESLASAQPGSQIVAASSPLAASVTKTQVGAPGDADLECRVAIWALQTGQGSTIQISGSTGNRMIRRLTELPKRSFQIHAMYLHGVETGLGQEFQLLTSLSNLQQLMIYSSLGLTLTDEETRVFSHLQTLTFLHLHGNRFKSPESAFHEIAKLTELQSLTIDNSNVSDAHVDALQELTALTWLSLSNTKISDVGLQQLNNLMQLTYLNVSRTSVTTGGARAFTDQHPHCKVVR